MNQMQDQQQQQQQQNNQQQLQQVHVNNSYGLNQFLYGHVYMFSIRVPNIVFIIVLLLMVYALYECNKTHHYASYRPSFLNGGANLGAAINGLELSSSVGNNSTFFREVGL